MIRPPEPIMMRIAIDAHAVGGHLTGNETYIRNLIRYLAKEDSNNQYTLFYTEPDAAAQLMETGANFESKRLWPANPLVRISLGMPLALRKCQADLVHVQYVSTLVGGPPVVVTVHDLSYEHHPEFFTKSEALRLKATVRLTLRRASHVFTVSEFSKKDIVDFYGIPEERISVTYDAVDPEFKKELPGKFIGEVCSSFAGASKFILTVGNLQPRKNLVRLIRAYTRLRDCRPDIKHKLVIVGKQAWLYEPTLDCVRKNKWKEDIILTGYISNETLHALYAGADVFVYPSIFEGFGLPPLEAMASGTPVIASNRSALPEVVGKAGILIDPYDIEAMAATMASLILDSNIHKWYSEKGPAQAERFRWEDCAKTTLDIYNRVVSENRAGRRVAGR